MLHRPRGINAKWRRVCIPTPVSLFLSQHIT